MFKFTKWPNDFIDGLIRCGCLVYGYPKLVQSENGWELDNGDFFSFARNHDFEKKTTAAYTHRGQTELLN